MSDHPHFVPGVGFEPRPCSRHIMAVVFVTHTGWLVMQCRSCGQGDIIAPEEQGDSPGKDRET